MRIFNTIATRWRCRTAQGRRAQRERDAVTVWPAIWVACGEQPGRFIWESTRWMLDQPAWRDSDEWEDEASSPGRWAARKWNARVRT